MKLFDPHNYLKLTAAVLLLFSLGLIFMPGYVMQQLDIVYSDTGKVFIQFLGASLAGHAYLNWHAAHIKGETLRPVLYMNKIALILAVALSLIAWLSDAYTKLGVLILLMHLVFLSGFVIAIKKLK